MSKDEKHGYQLHQTTPNYLDLVRSHIEPYFFNLNGEEILILPGVMSPKYDWAGHYMIENLPDVNGKEVLEIGCGCGLVSMAALRKGAKKVVAVDINDIAVKNTNLNFERMGSNFNGIAFYSDVFSAVSGSFDVIIFNAPYHGCKANDDLEKGVADEGYYALRSFFKDFGVFLKNDGIIALGFSSSGDHDLFDSMIKTANLKKIHFFEDFREGYQCEVHLLRQA